MIVDTKLPRGTFDTREVVANWTEQGVKALGQALPRCKIEDESSGGRLIFSASDPTPFPGF